MTFQISKGNSSTKIDIEAINFEFDFMAIKIHHPLRYDQNPLVNESVMGIAVQEKMLISNQYI